MREHPSPMLKSPCEFLDEVRKVLAEPDGLADNVDPHFQLEWFVLLAETAMPAGARLAFQPLASDFSGARSYLPLMVLPDQSGIISGLSNFYTPLFALTDEVHADSSAIERLASDLKKGKPRYSEARFSPMDPDSNSFAMLKSGFRRAGWWVGDYFCFVNWYERVEPGNALGYLAERPSTLKNTIRRAEKKLENTPGYHLEIVQQPGESLTRAIAGFTQVYSRSWKQPEPYPQFIPGLCRLAAQKGWLRLGVASVNETPIAAQLWLVVAGKAHIVKLAYDQEYFKTSVGTVLSAALFRHVIDVDRVEEIDYLIGDDRYKQDWMSLSRERRGLIAFNPRTFSGIALAVRHIAGKFWRQMKSFLVR